VNELRMTYIGGPTALVGWRGLRLLTDPTFDPAGSVYRTAAYELRKTLDPALTADALGRLDGVLLSHDHHFDNLDHSGRALLARVPRVLTTAAGAERLKDNAVGLTIWQEVDIPAPGGRVLRVTATPARHGPAHADRGPVVGFALAFLDDPTDVLYLSGDTVWYEGVREVSERFAVRTAVLFMGAARVRAVGEWHLTFTAAEGVEAAQAFSKATIVPVHFEGWDHFSESRPEIDRAFREAGLGPRLRWLAPGRSEAPLRGHEAHEDVRARR
jgi:L-ascorbate metabolism protein UlaG (beta-lactamase superfamily)